MVSAQHLFMRVVASGDPDVPDGTVGTLVNVFPDCVVIETPPDPSAPAGGQWIVRREAVSLVESPADSAA